jgi:hypothetical protein
MRIIMKKKTVWILLLLVAVGGLVFFITRRSGEETQEQPEETEIEEVQEEEEGEEIEEQEEALEEEDTEEDSATAADFSSFSSEAQVLGEESEAQFSIEGIEDVSRDGFHQFTFTLTTEDEEDPFVTASYLSNQGVIRLDFQGIEGDSSGIGYQQERRIDDEGVTRIYHNISGQEDQELYDIGVASSTTFYLTSQQLEEGTWGVILQVKYPGSTDFEVDLGSEEFSDEVQSIEGVTAEDGAAISAYTYSGTSGLLKLVWTVTSNVDNPIPSVTAEYNSEDDLVVTFESLSMDRVASFADTLTLPSSITAEVEREGESSIYTFTGMGEVREFKLSASLSPNQVILEIK